MALLAIPGESDKFAWSKFEQPSAGPQGENQMRRRMRYAYPAYEIA